MGFPKICLAPGVRPAHVAEAVKRDDRVPNRRSPLKKGRTPAENSVKGNTLVKTPAIIAANAFSTSTPRLLPTIGPGKSVRRVKSED